MSDHPLGKKKPARSAIVTPKTAAERQISAMPPRSAAARERLAQLPPLVVGGQGLVEGPDRVMRPPVAAPLKVARIYLRVSTDEQDLQRQESMLETARSAGYYVAGVYREKASGARADRPELLRMIADLQPGEVVMAEKIDRISRLPLADAEALVDAIKGKGARLAVPGVVDLSELAAGAEGTTRIVLEAVQAMLLRLALQIARDDYEARRERQQQGIELARSAGKYRGRREDVAMHDRIVALRRSHSIAETARLAGCSASQVKRVMALRRPTAQSD